MNNVITHSPLTNPNDRENSSNFIAHYHQHTSTINDVRYLLIRPTFCSAMTQDRLNVYGLPLIQLIFHK